VKYYTFIIYWSANHASNQTKLTLGDWLCISMHFFEALRKVPAERHPERIWLDNRLQMNFL